ncbi:hypothetical protein QPX11_01645 [Corynebacterium propinquum]|nr:hypothetical protein [Corynebacterium propinquum]MDK4251046.1 hypothetical protein [Corynebacterium propinquum]
MHIRSQTGYVDKFRDALGTRDINGAEVRLALELSHWLNNAETN